MALRLVSTLGLAASAFAISSQTAETANPIRRVVTMLQKMQKKVAEEGKRDEALFEKYMCYCTTGQKDLEASIKRAETEMPQITSALTEAKAKKGQLQADLKTHRTDRADAREALAKATAIRKKEAATFAQEEADMKANLQAMRKAIDSIEKGASAGFLQTSSAADLRRMAINMELTSADRDMLSAFLSQGQSDENEYAPASGEITGILKQMEATMADNLEDLQKKEASAKASFEDLSASKKQEIALNSKSIEDKSVRVGQVGVEIENLKADLSDTSGNYAEDKDFLANLDKNCETKKNEWDVVQKTRADELVALADTIKILNDDDALELFKKTLPSPSLLQLKVQSQQMRGQALKVLKAFARDRAADPRLDFLMLAVRGKKVSFEKVLGMIKEMQAILKKEQEDDDSKKSYCEAELDESEDRQKMLELTISDLKKASVETESNIETLSKEIDALSAGIRALDKSVAAATVNRKEENAEYKKVMASDTAAKEILKMAKNRLYQFYNPNLATKPQTPSFVQVNLHAHRGVGAPPPPPEAVGAYQKKGQDSAGVLSMMDLLVQDLDKEMTEMETEEKDSQADYEKFTQDSATKRTVDKKSLESKQGMKAEAEVLLAKTQQEKKVKVQEAYANTRVIGGLHQECDWLVSNYDVRKEARVGELDSLSKAMAILSGADFSLMQAISGHRRLRGER